MAYSLTRLLLRPEARTYHQIMRLIITTIIVIVCRWDQIAGSSKVERPTIATTTNEIEERSALI